MKITDEMVELAEKAGHSTETAWSPYYEEFDLRAAIAAVAPLIAAAEREECARIAERRASEGVASAALALAGSDYMRGMTDTSDAVARAIRARGETK